eukprot:GHVU01135160.1.p1 GENE.GHVU01135160.1~~GHVU01135160.1.p1  ORF type:complete len:544 (+),score=49.64 GHVU01135160.1:106-1632(+)
MAADLQVVANKRTQTEDIEHAIVLYNCELQAILDKHAPTKVKSAPVKPSPPWLTDDLIDLIRKRRRLERKWHSDPLNESKETAFLQYREHTRTTLKRAESNYHCELLKKSSGDAKQLYRHCNKILGRNLDMPLPPAANNQKLATEFNDYFIEKINKIKEVVAAELPSFLEVGESILDPIPDTPSPHRFDSFAQMTLDQVKRTLLSMPTKSCEQDPITTTLVKEYIDSLAPGITAIVNLSLQSGSFTGSLKTALVRPLLKKTNLPPIFKNYRPVSNLSFISKLLEKCVAKQLTNYVSRNRLSEPLQSAYRAAHCTETAILKVKSDILENMARQRVTALILLDLSAAFDTVNYDVLLHRLQYRFGITGLVLKWFREYLTNRNQCVVIDNTHSEKVTLDQGVPQGSVLGPLCFTYYTAPLGDICREHGVNFHMYADDTQMYLAFDSSKESTYHTTMNKLNACISSVRKWMCKNMLKLNNDKTEVIFVGTRQQLAKCEDKIRQLQDICGEKK